MRPLPDLCFHSLSRDLRFDHHCSPRIPIDNYRLAAELQRHFVDHIVQRQQTTPIHPPLEDLVGRRQGVIRRNPGRTPEPGLVHRRPRF